MAVQTHPPPRDQGVQTELRMDQVRDQDQVTSIPSSRADAGEPAAATAVGACVPDELLEPPAVSTSPGKGLAEECGAPAAPGQGGGGGAHLRQREEAGSWWEPSRTRELMAQSWDTEALGRATARSRAWVQGTPATLAYDSLLASSSGSSFFASTSSGLTISPARAYVGQGQGLGGGPRLQPPSWHQDRGVHATAIPDMQDLGVAYMGHARPSVGKQHAGSGNGMEQGRSSMGMGMPRSSSHLSPPPASKRSRPTWDTLIGPLAGQLLASAGAGVEAGRPAALRGSLSFTRAEQAAAPHEERSVSLAATLSGHAGVPLHLLPPRHLHGRAGSSTPGQLGAAATPAERAGPVMMPPPPLPTGGHTHASMQYRVMQASSAAVSANEGLVRFAPPSVLRNLTNTQPPPAGGAAHGKHAFPYTPAGVAAPWAAAGSRLMLGSEGVGHAGLLDVVDMDAPAHLRTQLPEMLLRYLQPGDEVL